MRRQTPTRHFGGWLEDLVSMATTTSPITSQQQQQPTVAPTESFFVKNAGLIMGASVLMIAGITLLILNQRNKA